MKVKKKDKVFLSAYVVVFLLIVLAYKIGLVGGEDVAQTIRFAKGSLKGLSVMSLAKRQTWDEIGVMKEFGAKVAYRSSDQANAKGVLVLYSGPPEEITGDREIIIKENGMTVGTLGVTTGLDKVAMRYRIARWAIWYKKGGWKAGPRACGADQPRRSNKNWILES